MLSDEALKWLNLIHYENFNLEDRMILLKAAEIAYSKNEEKEGKENV